MTDYKLSEEKREYYRRKQREYRERLKKKAETGDMAATRQIQKSKEKTGFYKAKSYIKTKATEEELSILRQAILDREALLKKEK
ncbi:hypothetical protein [Lactobacillus psittaci]|uniref:Uncharacterized protein n=1 Tax=Lactobacillus psittaci DSM 15354 TaxID=1122152 RepID=A0A0R1SAY6_9LACO|nr:hypothetical protein [Lactobacillus psittaci]KRL63525.1 hypothetical protein FC23_GL000768 [Lactobacillus psittaci DSM 15354]